MSEEKRKRGRPPGSVKRPKPEVQFNGFEKKIVSNLDDIVSMMVDRALSGDTAIAKYLIDRVAGRPTEKSVIETKGEQTIKVEYVEDWRNS